jgi:hypothetical protein
MGSQNAERLRAGYEVFAASGSWPEGQKLLAEDFELHQDPILDDARVFRGTGAPEELLTLVAGAVSEPTVEAERLIDLPTGEIVAFVCVSGHGKASGIAINRHQAHIWQFEGDQARRMTVHGSPAEALRALGLDDWPGGSSD